MVKILYLMRHGQTVLNEQKRIQGWFDSPLTELGRQQAQHAGEELARRGVHIDRAICSTSERCSDTLELALGGLGVPDMPYTRIRSIKEMDFGLLEGESERLACEDPVGCRTYYLPFGGESSDAVRDRMVRALAQEMDELEGESLLAVSHGGSCFNFSRALGESTWFGNCSVAVLEYDARYGAANGEAVSSVDSLGAPLPPEIACAAAAFTLRDIIRVD